MFSFIIMVFVWCMLWMLWIGLWLHGNWETHTVEWRNERLMEWVQRPLPVPPINEDRKKIQVLFPSEEWENYPYWLVDAIIKPKEDANQVIKWAIYYTVPDFIHDEEYRRIEDLSV